MNQTKIDKIKIHLRALAELHELTKIDNVTWQSKYKTRYVCTIHGFILDTDEHRNYNFQLIGL